MSFFSKFFKAKTPETTEQRIARLNEYDQEQLVNVVHSNETEEVRLAAAEQVKEPNHVLGLATSENLPGAIKTAARKKLARLIEEGALPIDSVKDAVTDIKALLAICGYSPKAIAPLLDQVEDETLLVQIAEQGSTAQLRQEACLRVTGPEHLDRLLKHAKGRDKAVYKIAKNKLDAYKAEHAKQILAQTEAEKICSQLQQLKTSPADTVFVAQLRVLQSNWEALKNAVDTSTRERYQNLQQECQNVLDEAARQEQAAREHDRFKAELQTELRSAAEQMRELIDRLLNTEQPPEQLKLDLEGREQRQKELLDNAKTHGLNLEKEASNLSSLTQTAKEVLQKLEAYGTLPQLMKQLKDTGQEQKTRIKKQIDEIAQTVKTVYDEHGADILREARNQAGQWAEQLHEQIRQRNEQMKSAAELIRKGHRAAGGGQVRRAKAILAELDALMESLEDVPPHLINKLEDLKQEVDKLGDWHEFAVTPKKQALVDEMRALHDSELPPNDLAERIYKLQNQWKELCRGGQNQDEELWKAFHEAGQTAYEPCKRYFEEQTQQREDNEDKRRTLIQQLNEYLKAYDWDNANWPEVEKTLKVSREAWQSYWPVTRKNIKLLQAEFDGVMDALHAKLNAEYERNRLKKQSLADQAEKLLEQQDLNVAIDTAKRLQQQWRSVGRCRRKDDQMIWKRFRKCCDDIFERRQQQSESFRKELQDNLATALGIVEQLEGIPKLEGEAFFQARNNVNELQQAYADIEQLPKGKTEEISARLDKALNAIVRRADRLREQAAQDNWLKIFALADEVRKLELQEKAREEHVHTLEDELGHIERWPGNVQTILQRRLENALPHKPADLAENERALRVVCIKAEVANNLESPEEDRALRMEYQVNQLQKGLGGAREDAGSDSVQSLAEEWLAIGPTSDQQYQSLYTRFTRTVGWKEKTSA